MYYHITASGRLYATHQPLESLEFQLNEAHHCLIHSNAPNQKSAWDGRQQLLLRLTQRRLEQWLTQALSNR